MNCRVNVETSRFFIRRLKRYHQSKEFTCRSPHPPNFACNRVICTFFYKEYNQKTNTYIIVIWHREVVGTDFNIFKQSIAVSTSVDAEKAIIKRLFIQSAYICQRHFS